MGRKSISGGVRPAGDRIELTFSFQGKRLRPTLDLRPTEPNLKHARRLVDDIKRRIAIGAFNLAAEFTEYRRLAAHVAPAAPSAPTEQPKTFSDAADLYERLFCGDLKHATVKGNERILKAVWRPRFGATPIASITDVDVLEAKKELEVAAAAVGKKVAPNTWNNHLGPLRKVFEVAVSQKWIAQSPLGLVKNRKRQKPKPDPFNVEDVDLVLAAIKRHNEVVAEFFEFAIATGLRPSEQIALKWPKVDLRAGTILIDSAKVWTVDNDSTKTNVERTIELKPRARQVIERQRARSQLAGGAVFLNPITGKEWSSDKKLHAWWTASLKGLGVRYRKPYNTRSTSISWRLMAGENVMLVAEEHGHSVETMLKSYAKWARGANEKKNAQVVAAIKAWFRGFASDMPVKKHSAG